MSFIHYYGPTSVVPNWLGSEIGLITKTRQIPESMGLPDGRYKKVASGVIFPANDATAEGIVFSPEGIDVTDGDMPGAVMIAGRVLKNRLPVAPSEAAITALTAKGIYFDTAPEFTR